MRKFALICLLSSCFVVQTSCSSIKPVRCNKAELNLYRENPNYFGSNGRAIDEIYLVMNCSSGKLYRISKKYFKSNQEIYGKSLYEFTILPSGSVTNVKILKSESNNVDFHNEVTIFLSSLKFSKKDIDKVVIKYPIDITHDW